MVGGAPTQEIATTLEREIGYGHEDEYEDEDKGTLKKARTEAVASRSVAMEIGT